MRASTQILNGSRENVVTDATTARIAEPRRVRRRWCVVAACTGLLWVGVMPVVSAESFETPPEGKEAKGASRHHYSRECRKLLKGRLTTSAAPAKLVKRVARVDRADGSAVFTVTLEGADVQASSDVSVLDCVWIDNDANGRWNGERLMPYRIDGADVLESDGPPSVVFTVRVAGVAGATVCDAAATLTMPPSAAPTTERTTGWWRRLRISGASGVVCSAAGPDPVIPEVPVVPLLTGSAVATIWVLSRRHVRAAGRG